MYRLLQDPSFVAHVRWLCARLGIPDHRMLLAAMVFESRLDPAAVNPKSGAAGLIQFTAKTAARLGTSCDALRAMTAFRQLAYVENYLRDYRGRMKTCPDVYMAILCPVAIGKPDSYVLPYKDRAYLQNRGLDLNLDGHITKAEAAHKVVGIYNGLCATMYGPLPQAGGRDLVACPVPADNPKQEGD